MVRCIFLNIIQFVIHLALLFGGGKAYGQNHDFNRLQTIFTWDGDFGVGKIEVDSIQDTIMYGPIMTKKYLPYYSNICMSDSLGNFIFGSNCIEVYDRNFNMMRFGDSLSTIGPYSDKTVYPPENEKKYGYNSGFVNPIPLPGMPNQYVFFYTTWYFDYLRRYSQAMLYCRVDMKDSEGIVVEKNVLIQSNNTDKPILIKHGNGIDWWLISANRWNTDIYIYLINSEGIIGPKIKQVGTIADSTQWYQFAYNHNRLSASPDGERIASQKTNYVDFFKFDRCSGDITMQQNVMQFEIGFPKKNITAFEWSPNSQNYFYTIGSELFQINIENPELALRSKKVGQVTTPYLFSFFHMVSNKLVTGCYNTQLYPPLLALISDSDLPGTKVQISSNLFYNYPIQSPIINFGVFPNNPNYKLSKLLESEICKEDSFFSVSLADPEGFIKDGKQYYKLLRKFK